SDIGSRTAGPHAAAPAGRRQYGGGTHRGQRRMQTGTVGSNWQDGLRGLIKPVGPIAASARGRPVSSSTLGRGRRGQHPIQGQVDRQQPLEPISAKARQTKLEG